MLKKLLKYEWKSVSRILLPLNLGIVLLTIIGCVILSTDIFDSEQALPLALLLFLFYTLSVITFTGITLIYIYVHFYKNLFTAEGYLFHTLPVTRTQLFHSKLFVGSFWCSINSLLTVLSAAALGFAAGFHAAAVDNIDSMQGLLMDGSIAKTADRTSADFIFSEIFGFSPVVFVIVLVLMLVTSCISSVLMGYLSILLGQLIEKFRLAASIGFYMAIYIVTQVLASIVMIVPNLHLFLDNSDESSKYFLSSFFCSMLPAAIITQLILILIFYAASIFLIRRSVNLE